MSGLRLADVVVKNSALDAMGKFKPTLSRSPRWPKMPRQRNAFTIAPAGNDPALNPRQSPADSWFGVSPAPTFRCIVRGMAKQTCSPKPRFLRQGDCL
jgi:hypothetical protein